MNPLNPQIDIVARALQFTEQNHHVVSQNLANVNTPNFTTKEMSFEDFMKAAAEAEGATPEIDIQEVQGLPMRADGNNVSLDRELAGLKKNAMAYQTLTEIMASQMNIMRKAITG